MRVDVRPWRAALRRARSVALTAFAITTSVERENIGQLISAPARYSLYDRIVWNDDKLKTRVTVIDTPESSRLVHAPRLPN